MTADEQAIRAAVASWMEASIEGDIARVLGLIDDDAVFLTPGRPPMRKSDFEAASKAMAGKIRLDGVSEVQEVRVFGEWAYVWTQLSITMHVRDAPQHPADGKAVHRAGPGLSVWRRRADGAWVIYRDGNMLTTLEGASGR
jgi:uncharacterized protein (TIGR02246 family)